MKRVLAALGLVAAAALSAILPAAPAAAGIGGSIHNGSSTLSLRVCEHYSGTAADPGCWNGSPTTYISPGKYAPWPDDDAFYVPAGYDAWKRVGNKAYKVYATGWHKVTDGTSVSVALVPQP